MIGPARTVLVLALVLGPHAAHAQPATSAAEESATAGTTSATEAQRQEARKLHARGLALYDIGRFDEAITAFKEAYALSPAAGLLFNIAQCHRAKGPEGCSEALRFYRTYLRAAPNADNRVFVLARIADMEACEREQASERQRQRQPAAAPAPATARDERAPSRSTASVGSSFPWAPLVTGAVGAGAAAVGLGLYLSSHREYQRLEGTCDGRCAPSEWERYERRQQLGVGLAIGGGVVLAASVAWWLITRSDGERPPSSAFASSAMASF